MSKFDRYDDYPDRGLAKAQAALLTVWPSLNRYHDDLVLVGGLAVHCLTRPVPGGQVIRPHAPRLRGVPTQFPVVEPDLAPMGQENR